MRRLASAPPGTSVRITLDDEELSGVAGEPAAVSLLAAGHRIFSRSVKYHRPRGPFCLEGACSHCLMRVDGVPNVFTCRVPAREGMRLERQNAFPSATLDVFSAIDVLFPGGFDHHHFLAGFPGAREVMTRVARQLAGLGRLPDAEGPPVPPAEVRHTRAVVVGGGPAGAAAATAFAQHAIPFVLCEREAPVEWNKSVARATDLFHSTVLGVYRHGADFLLPVLCAPPGGPPRLVALHAERLVLATGGHASLLPFEDNDIPGVFSGSAALRLLDHGVGVGDRPVLVGETAALDPVARRLAAAGVAPVLTLALDETALRAQVSPLGARGSPEVTAFTYRDVTGQEHTVDCDAVVVCAAPAPAFELAKQAGAELAYAPEAGGFVAITDAAQRTTVPHVWAAGTLAGARDETAARASGERAGRDAAGSLR